MDLKEKQEQKEIAEAIESWRQSRPDLIERLEAKRKSDAIYLRFPEDLRIGLKLLAAKEHMGYQTYLKRVLRKHLERAKKKGLIAEEMIAKVMNG